MGLFIAAMFFFWMDSVETELVTMRQYLKSILDKDSAKNTDPGMSDRERMADAVSIPVVRDRVNSGAYKGDCPDVPRKQGEDDSSYWERVRNAGF